MKPCPECHSKEVYKYKESVDAEGPYGPNLLPKLNQGWFKAAKFIPVVCLDCGYVRFFASKESRLKLGESEHWEEA